MNKKTFDKKTLFKTDIYSKILTNIDDKKIIKYINKLDKKTIKVNKSNYGGWHSHWYFDPFPSCLEDLNKEINSFMKKNYT